MQNKYNRRPSKKNPPPPPVIADEASFPFLVPGYGTKQHTGSRAWSNVVLNQQESSQFSMSQQLQLMTNMMATVNDMLTKLADMIKILTQAIPTQVMRNNAAVAST